MDLLLKNLSWYAQGKDFSGDIRISQGIISEIVDNLQPKRKERVLDLKNHFVYPGLINAHDHLEMNLYPRLGAPPYSNYINWAEDIYKPKESPLKEIEKINIKDRLLWGGIKSIISGVTTVIHHNPWHRSLGKKEFPVRVLKNLVWAHSLAFEKNISKSFPKKDTVPFVIHAGEGLDELAFSEVYKLRELGLLRNNTVLIHAIGLRENDIETLSRQKSSVVWCPASNLYLFNQTAPIQHLKRKVKIALGSDSTLTGSSTLLDEMKVGIGTGLATSEEIFNMVTTTPAEIFNLKAPSINVFKSADLFIAPIKHKNYWQNIIETNPSDIIMVLAEGKLRLADAKVADDLGPMKHTVKIQGALKYLDVDVAKLMKRIEKKVGAQILDKNPLWCLIRN
jgi:cytosine/adenosine deaminase-related metal-dependent hydrolase